MPIEGVIFWLVVIGCVVGKAWYDHELLTKNPEAWKAKKAAEEAANEKKWRRVGSVAKGGIGIARIFFKR